MPSKTIVYATRNILARASAARIVLALSDLLASKEAVHVGIAGGFVSNHVLKEVARFPLSADLDWSGLQVWWVDERFVGSDRSERNDAQALAALDGIWDSAHFHRIGSANDFSTATEAAKAYQAELEAELTPSFDLAILGMGPDGHVASIFPSRPAGEQSAYAVFDSPKPPAIRVTVSMGLLRACKKRFIILSGEEKSTAFAKAIAAGISSEKCPAAALNMSGTYWLTDLAAAGN